MTKLTNMFLGTAALAAVVMALPAAADDDTTTPVYVDQLQLDDIWSNVSVHLKSSTSDVTASGLAVSNASTTSIAHGGLTTDTRQVSAANVGSNVKVNAWDVSNGAIIAANNATGNSSYAGNWYGNGLAAIEQTQIGDVTASTHIRTDRAEEISAHTTAAANVSEIASDYGHHVDTIQEQFANATVTAASHVRAGAVGGTLVNATVAAGNSADAAVDGVPDAWVNANQTTSSHTFVTSNAQSTVNSADTAVTAAAAAGNQFNASALNSNTTIGRPGAELNQENNAQVTAIARTNVTTFTTEASAIGAGVGNSAQVSALGGTVDYNAVQNNNASVGTYVTLNTGMLSGGAGHASASSFGNNYGIVAQDSALGGSVVQTNTASIIANSRIKAGHIGPVNASSAAVGNTATFETRATGQGH